jgi:hypothetical protein
MCNKCIEPSERLGWRALGTSWALSVTITFLALAFAASARSQEPPPPVASIAEVARSVREQKSDSAKHPKIITNDDLGTQYSEPSASASFLESSFINGAEVPKPSTAECENPEAERIKMDLEAAQEEQDQIHRELSYQPLVMADGDVDLTNFKPGYSGIYIGAPPLLETEPPVPARVREVSLDEEITSLKTALQIACEPPKEAAIQMKLDHAEQELHLLQRQLVLDQAAYYSNANYAEDTAGKAKLDVELQQAQDLQSEIERLKDELAASKTNQSAN